MLPSALRSTLTVQVAPVALFPCFTIVSAWATVAPTMQAVASDRAMRCDAIGLAPEKGLPHQKGTAPRGRSG
jgi:hypothetical protein